MSLRIETFVVGPLPNNLYLLIDEDGGEAVVIDPSIDSAQALARVRELQNSGVLLRAIWNTHGHFDHIYDNAVWRDEFDVPLLAHPGDELFLDRLPEMAHWFGLPEPELAMPTGELVEGLIVRVGSHEARILHTPGHSPGSVSFYFAEDNVCISGDVLFRNSVGRTDLPGCSFAQLQDSLRKLAALPAETRVLSGHGEETTIGAETRSNPYYRDLLES